MPWANGLFTLLPVSHADPGTTIRAEQQNGPHEDFAAGFNNCLTRDGSTSMLANLPMNGRKIVNLAQGTAASDAVRLDQLPASSEWLEAVAALTMAADRFPYATGPTAAALATLTAFARTLLDDPDAATARATLGLGALATKDKAALADIDATGTRGDTTYLRGDGEWFAPLIRTSAVSTSSGTVAQFTGIKNANKIILTFNNVSLDSAGNLLVQIGTTAGYLDTGYLSNGLTITTNGAGVSATDGMVMRIASVPGGISGHMTMTRVPGSQTWVASYNGISLNATGVQTGGGTVTAPGDLDRVRVIPTSGTFDAGQIFIEISA